MDVNILDYPYSATPLLHRAGGNTGTILASADTISQTGAFSDVEAGDTLWIQTGDQIGTYIITYADSDSATVLYQNLSSTEIDGSVRWKVTQGNVASYDCTDAFQNAINDVTVEGGIVHVPPGYYYFADVITVYQNVLLKGFWTLPPQWNEDFWINGTVQGPVLCPTSGMGDDGTYHSPFITLDGSSRNSGVQGLSVYYPLQGVVSGSGTTDVGVIPYPYCIAMGGFINGFVHPHSCLDQRVLDLLMINPYQGIRMIGGRNQINNVFGCALKCGVFVDWLTDFSTIEKVQFHPDFYVQSTDDAFATDIRTWLAVNLTAFEIREADGLVLRGITAWMLNRGLVLKTSDSTGANPTIYGTEILFDACDVSLEISAGIASITDFVFSASFPDDVVNDSSVFDTLQCVSGESDTAQPSLNLVLSNGTMSTQGADRVVYWSIEEGQIDIGDVLVEYDTEATAYGIYADKGRLIIHDNRFQYAGSANTKTIVMMPGVEKATVYGNDYLNNLPPFNGAVDNSFTINGLLDLQTNAGNNGVLIESVPTLTDDGTGNSPFLTFKDSSMDTSNRYAMKYNGAMQTFYMGKGDATSGFTAQVAIDQPTGNVTLSSLADSTTRIVAADASGTLTPAGEIKTGTFAAQLVDPNGAMPDMSASGTISYVKIGGLVSLLFPQLLGNSSHFGTLYISGLPSELFPSITNVVAAMQILDNSNTYAGAIAIFTDGTVQLFYRNALNTNVQGNFTASGTKGLDNVTISYQL